MSNPFTTHPASVGESYFAHMGQAFSFAGAMFVGAFACAAHGLLPFLFLKTGSGVVTRLHDQMTVHRIKPDNLRRVPPAPAE